MMKRFYLSLAAVGATAALLTAGSFALFTANTTNVSNTFTAGTVTLDAPVSTLINVATIAPGDSGTAGGAFAVTYTGNLDAWLGVIAIKDPGTIFAAPTPLAVTLSDGTNSYAVDGVMHVVGSTPVSTNAVKTFTVNYAMPLAAGNSYQGATGSVSVSVKAVQSKNNTNGAGTGPASWN